MIDLPSDIEDRAAYPLVDQADRWIFNKLTVAELMGYNCGPSGTPVTVAGTYCVRPVMNCAGNGLGGVYKHEAVDDGEGGLTQPPFIPGYFWCEWFDGTQMWTDFTDDVAVNEAYSTGYSNGRLDYLSRYDNFGYNRLPPLLQGLSKHLLVETIDNKVIELSPRHQTYAWGRDESYMQKVRLKLTWGFDDHEMQAWYWRTIRL